MGCTRSPIADCGYTILGQAFACAQTSSWRRSRSHDRLPLHHHQPAAVPAAVRRAGAAQRPDLWEDMDKVQRCLFDPIFTEDTAQQKFFLERQARVMAGHVEDKYWMVMLGNRNCGKSVLVMLCGAILVSGEPNIGTLVS